MTADVILVSRISLVEHPADRCRHVLARCLRGHRLPADTARGTEESHRPIARQLPFDRTDRGDVLFSTVVQQLRNLPSYVDTELTPPTVVLDSKSSSDGARCARHLRHGPRHMTTDRSIASPTTTHNGRFRSLGVRPGDILKYYVLYDEDSAETGISQTVSMDLTVAQVLDDNSLLFEGSLRIPVTEPAKIEIWRYSDERLNDIARALATYERYRQPVFDWEPSPDSRVLKQMTERLNQWMRQSQPKTKWSADPLVATLDPEIAKDDRLAPLITPTALADSGGPAARRPAAAGGGLAPRHLRAGPKATASTTSPAPRRIFDWIVRNVQLDRRQTRPCCIGPGKRSSTATAPPSSGPGCSR